MPCCSGKPASGAKGRTVFHEALDGTNDPFSTFKEKAQNKKLYSLLIDGPDDQGHTVLQIASRDGMVDVVKYIVDPNERRGSPGGCCSSSEREPSDVVVEAIMEHRDDEGQTSLTLAAMFNQLEVVKVLIKAAEKHAPEYKKKHLNALGLKKGMKLKKGEAWTLDHGDGRTPLMWAAKCAMLHMISTRPFICDWSPFFPCSCCPFVRLFVCPSALLTAPSLAHRLVAARQERQRRNGGGVD